MSLVFARRCISLLLFAIAAIVLASMAWPAFAHAADGTPPPADVPLLDLARLIYQGVTSGQLSYFGAAAGVLVLVTRVLRSYGAQLVPWFGGDAGGTVLVFGGSLGGALLTAALGGASPSLSLMWTSLLVGASAAGGYSAIKRLVITPLRPRVASWPAWARAVFAVVAWAFDRAEVKHARSPAPVVASLLVLMAISSCATAKHAVAVGADTAIVCQTESLTGLAYEAYELSRVFVMHQITGAGDVDTAAIRAAARAVKSDAGRCAFAAAMAAATDVLQARRGALGVGPPPSYVLRETLAVIARDDWQRLVILDGESAQ